MSTSRALAALSLVFTIAASHAFAQDAATPVTTDAKSLPAETAKSDIKYVLAGGYAHFFNTDFDSGGGTVEVDRGFGSLDISSAPTAEYGWNLGFAWEGSWYGFDDGGTLATAAGGKPWDAVQSIVISPGASF